MMQKPLVLTTLATVSLFAIPAQAVTIQFDTTSIFNADVVVNNAGGTINSAGRTPLDLSDQALITNSAAAQLSPSGNGLPDNGFFAANSFHPDVQLSFSNSTSRPNARRAFSSTSFKATPEPASTLAILGLGLGTLVAKARKLG
jgi:subtilase family serine protease